MIHFFAMAFAAVFVILTHHCIATEVLSADRLRFIRFVDDVKIESRPDIFEIILENLKTAELTNKNTGNAEAYPQCGIAWADLPYASLPVRSIVLAKPTIMEAIDAACKLQGLRAHNLGNGIVILPVSTPLRSRGAVIRTETRYTGMLLNFPFRFVLRHVPTKEADLVINALNERFIRDSGKGLFQETVTIENHADYSNGKKLKNKINVSNIAINAEGTWTYNDFLYAYAVLGGFCIVEDRPKHLILEHAAKAGDASTRPDKVLTGR